MSYNTKSILKDKDGRPIPQYYNPTTDTFEPLQGASGAGTFQVAGRKAQVQSGDYTQVLSVTAGGSTTLTITPPVGELWKIKMIRLYMPVPIGATTGDHALRVSQGGSVAPFSIIDISSTFSDAIDFYCNRVEKATSKAVPSTEIAQQNAVLSLVATNAQPLYFTYANGTNAAQSGALSLIINREVEYIVS
jgi:hypothetical protein